MTLFNRYLLWFNRYLLWPLLLTCHLLAGSLLAWHLLAQVNFGYPLGYRLLAIEQHIDRFGPENRYKNHFAQTNPEEHKQLFAEITHAVQNRGEGLAEISYRLPNGSTTPLMREPEVIHLQDVANLITQLYWAGGTAVLLLILLLAYAYRQRLALPSVKKILLGFAVALAVIAVAILLIGPVKFFYWLHVYLFPDEHEWFFYYQDSLMTTLMKAPDLFGFIAALLGGLIVVLWAASLLGMAYLLPGKNKRK
jgi:hypothetical protein